MRRLGNKVNTPTRTLCYRKQINAAYNFPQGIKVAPIARHRQSSLGRFSPNSPYVYSDAQAVTQAAEPRRPARAIARDLIEASPVSLSLTVEIDRTMLANIKRELAAIPGALLKAERGAVNKAASKGMTTLNKAIREDTPVKSGEIKKRMKLRSATKDNGVTATISYVGRALNSHQYRGLPKKPKSQKGIKRSGKRKSAGNYAKRKPPSVIYSKKAGRKKLIGAFVATMPNGKVGIFTRDKTRRRKPGKNAPIKAHFGPQIAQLARQSGADVKALAAIEQDLVIQLERQVGRFVDKK